MRVYTQVDAVLGPKRTFTPEGYLYCEDVPLARTGVQTYLPQELRGIPAGADGLIHVERPEEQVFADKALASFVAKPFTLNHPPANLNPKTYQAHVKGVVMNPRRGTGAHADMMVGDILVCDEATISAIVNDGIREVSGGYYAEYETLGPGRARQTEIVGNHVALVPRGRCGTACAIGDQAMDTVTAVSPTVVGRIVSWKDRAKAAALVNDQAALDAALAESGTMGMGAPGAGGGSNVHVHLGASTAPVVAPASVVGTKTDDSIAAVISRAVTDSMAPVLARLDALEAKDVGKSKEPTAEEKVAADKKTKEAKDAAVVVVHYSADQLPTMIQDTIARAEIILPGIKLSSLDAKGDPQQITDSICAQRRQTLTAALMMPVSQEVITPLLASQPRLESMTCDQIATVFTAASENMKVRNNAKSTTGGGSDTSVRTVGDQKFTGIVTPAEINARNRLLYARK